MSGKIRRITAAGNGGSRQAFQEHVVHEYLIALPTNIGFVLPFAGLIIAILSAASST
ncbi:hypothetical protein AB64_4862 [Escherichia coli 2-427-07_S1_C3]|nr:hypothetical protein AB64_4862 [Escherichia coli 2-427-07_S1_C3]